MFIWTKYLWSWQEIIKHICHLGKKLHIYFTPKRGCYVFYHRVRMISPALMKERLDARWIFEIFPFLFSPSYTDLKASKKFLSHFAQIIECCHFLSIQMWWTRHQVLWNVAIRSRRVKFWLSKTNIKFVCFKIYNN